MSALHVAAAPLDALQSASGGRENEGDGRTGWTGFAAAYAATGKVFWRGLAPRGMVREHRRVEATIARGLARRGFTAIRQGCVYASADCEQALGYTAPTRDQADRLRVVIPGDGAAIGYSPVSGDLHNWLEGWLWHDALDVIPERQRRLREVVYDMRGDLYILERYLEMGVRGLPEMLGGAFLDHLAPRQASGTDPTAIAEALETGHEVWVAGPTAVLTVEEAARLLSPIRAFGDGAEATLAPGMR